MTRFGLVRAELLVATTTSALVLGGATAAAQSAGLVALVACALALTAVATIASARRDVG